MLYASCMFVIIFTQEKEPLIYLGLIQRGAENELTQDVISYFETMVTDLSVSIEDKEMYGCYRMISFPRIDTGTILRIYTINGELLFSLLNDASCDDESYILSYKKISDNQFYIKHGIIIYNTTDGIYGKLLYPDGDIHSIFYLELMN